MTVDGTDGGPDPVTKQSERRYSVKSPGRVAFMQRLNQEGRGGIGGRRPTHGRRALAELLRRGLEEGSPIAILQREAEDAYLSDLGGAGQASAMDRGLVRRLAVLDLDLALLLAQRDGALRLTREQSSRLSQDLSRNSAAYTALVKTLGGPGRRTKPTDGKIYVRSSTESEPKPVAYQEQEK